GISGRARLFEVVQRVKEINRQRLSKAPGRKFTEKSASAAALDADPSLELDYIIAPPRMSYYIKVSSEIYNVYLKYVCPEDIHVYSIDEVFIDATSYLKAYRMSAHDFTMMLLRDVLETTAITATAGIGTNLYLAKIAMDIVAKHMPADKDGVRIAELDEMSYRHKLWEHRPITDFWRVGHGTARRLAENGIFTMGDIALASEENEELLYKLFGVNAELLIDHAWGWEPCTIREIKRYRPENNSISSGQVLMHPYDFEKGELIVKEMTDALVLDLVDKGLVTDQMVLTVGYDIENLSDAEKRKKYKGPVTTDHYGRSLPKSAHGSVNLGKHTSSTKLIMSAVTGLYERIVNRELTVRRMYVVANHVLREEDAPHDDAPEQLDLFTDYEELTARREREERELDRERRMQNALLDIKKRYGKNAILRGMNFEEGATARERNSQVGGHKA
ncbi:MAG: DNA methylase, partial [Oscillospiraceae bacterium]|nr:DNA methylase [Oscillospiraceae bacterium]